MKNYSVLFVITTLLFTQTADAQAKPGTLAGDYPIVAAGAAICQAMLMRSVSGIDPICATAMSDFGLAAVVPKALGLSDEHSAVVLLVAVPFTGGPSGTLTSPMLSHMHSAMNNSTLSGLVKHGNNTMLAPYAKTIAWATSLVATATPALLYKGDYKGLAGDTIIRLARKSGYVVLSMLGQFRQDLGETQFNYATYLATIGGGLYIFTGDTWLGYQAARYAMEGAGYQFAEVVSSAVSEKAKSNYADLAVSSAIAVVTSTIALKNGKDPTMFDRFKLGVALSGFIRATAAFLQLPTAIGIQATVVIGGLALQRRYAPRT